MIDSESRQRAFMVLAASLEFASDSPEWESLVRDVLQLPVWMVPAVKQALKYASWRNANDPMRSLKEHAERVAVRMGLVETESPPSKIDFTMGDVRFGPEILKTELLAIELLLNDNRAHAAGDRVQILMNHLREAGAAPVLVEDRARSSPDSASRIYNAVAVYLHPASEHGKRGHASQARADVRRAHNVFRATRWYPNPTVPKVE